MSVTASLVLSPPAQSILCTGTKQEPINPGSPKQKQRCHSPLMAEKVPNLRTVFKVLGVQFPTHLPSLVCHALLRAYGTTAWDHKITQTSWDFPNLCLCSNSSLYLECPYLSLHLIPIFCLHSLQDPAQAPSPLQRLPNSLSWSTCSHRTLHTGPHSFIHSWET